MFELVEPAGVKQFRDRIFALVLNDTNLYDPIKRIESVGWKAQHHDQQTSEAILTSEVCFLH